MTLLQHELTDFKVNAFQNDEFHEVTKADVLGHWSLFFSPILTRRRSAICT